MLQQLTAMTQSLQALAKQMESVQKDNSNLTRQLTRQQAAPVAAAAVTAAAAAATAAAGPSAGQAEVPMDLGG
jgi:hypothetical protein